MGVGGYVGVFGFGRVRVFSVFLCFSPPGGLLRKNEAFELIKLPQ